MKSISFRHFLPAALGLSTIVAPSLFPGWQCSANAAEKLVVKIGLLLPPDEPQGSSVSDGVLLARDQANKAGGQQVEIVIRGRTGQWGADGVEAARMVTDDGVEGLIAPPDGAATHLTLQVSGRTAVPVVSLCADSSVGRTGVPWTLRVVPRTEEEAKALFEGITAAAPPKTNRWTAIVPDARAGREISRDLNRAARSCGIRFEKILEVNRTLTNVVLIQEEALGSHPNIVLLWLDPLPSGQMAKSLRTAGYSGFLAGPCRLQSPDFIASAGNAFEGFIVPELIANHESEARWSSFRAEYRELWHHEPNPVAAMSYDATTLLIHLLRQPEFQAPPHRLAPGFSWPGVTGDLSFDSEGNRKLRLGLLRGHDQSFIKGN